MLSTTKGIDTKHSSVYTVSFEGTSGEHQNISFTHSVEADNASQAVGSEKSARIICSDRKFVYFCIGKRTEQSTIHTSHSPYIGEVLGAVPFFGSVRLPKQKRASLFLYTYIN